MIEGCDVKKNNTGILVEAIGLSVGWLVVIASSIYVLSLVMDCVELENNKIENEQTETTDQWRDINGY